jgi:hypothetical protein
MHIPKKPAGVLGICCLSTRKTPFYVSVKQENESRDTTAPAMYLANIGEFTATAPFRAQLQ